MGSLGALPDIDAAINKVTDTQMVKWLLQHLFCHTDQSCSIVFTLCLKSTVLASIALSQPEPAQLTVSLVRVLCFELAVSTTSTVKIATRTAYKHYSFVTVCMVLVSLPGAIRSNTVTNPIHSCSLTISLSHIPVLN